MDPSPYITCWRVTQTGDRKVVTARAGTHAFIHLLSYYHLLSNPLATEYAESPSGENPPQVAFLLKTPPWLSIELRTKLKFTALSGFRLVLLALLSFCSAITAF